MYEDNYGSPMLTVQLIADLMGTNYGDQVYRKVVHHSDMQEMKHSASIGLNHLRKGTVLAVVKQNLCTDLLYV